MLSSKDSWMVVTLLVCCAFAVTQTEAAHLVKREASTELQVPNYGNWNSSAGNTMLVTLLDNFAGMLWKIPLIGPLLYNFVMFINGFVRSFEALTNGALSTILSGFLPCTVSVENGLVCSGVSNNGGIVRLLMLALDNVPNDVLPNVVKGMIDLVVEIMMDPSSDVLFGGIRQLV